MSRSRRAPFTPGFAGKDEEEDENTSHHPGAEEVPAVALSADGDGEDHREKEEENAAEHSKSVRLPRPTGASFSAPVLKPTRDIKAFASVIAAIIVMVLAAKASASLSERTRTVFSIVLGSMGSLLVVDYLRDKLASQMRYCVLGVMAFILGSFSYLHLNGLHPRVVHLLVASLCGSSVVFGYEGAQRLHKWPKGTRKVVSDDALIAFGCWLIAIAAVMAISPL